MTSMRKVFMFAVGATPNSIGPLTSLTRVVAGRRSIKRYQGPLSAYLTPTVRERRSSASAAAAIWGTYSLENALPRRTLVIASTPLSLKFVAVEQG